MSKVPGFFPAGEGRTYQLGPLILTFKHDGAGATGSYSICEGRAPLEHSRIRLHRHEFEEWHIQIEGRCSWRIGGASVVAGPGDMVYVPSNVPHGFSGVGTGPGRQLLVNSPAGAFEGFISEVVAYLADGGRGDTDPIAARHGIEFLEPTQQG